jgi:hypothetical protein
MSSPPAVRDDLIAGGLSGEDVGAAASAFALIARMKRRGGGVVVEH